MSGKRQKQDPKSKFKLYQPLMAYSLLAVVLFVAERMIAHAVCKIQLTHAPNTACAFVLPTVVACLPLLLIGFGAVGTGWRLIRQKSHPEIH
jgi:predicted tellurium resistance membrane protein TerC